MGSSGNNKTTPDEDEQAYLFAFQLANGSVIPAVLKSAIELNLLEILSRAGEGEFLSPKEIAALIPTQNPEAAAVLDRILQFLVSCSVLKCRVRESPEEGVVERLYAVGPVCKYLTKNEDGFSMAPLVIMSQDKSATDNWHNLKDAVLEGGIPFNRAHGMSIFEYCSNDQRINNMFNQALSNESAIIMKKVLETYTGFGGLGSLVDVGGGVGVTLNMIISNYPSIKGINFDLPHVIDNAPISHGVEHVAGDMFARVPKGDAIFMKSICHDWTDANCLKLLKNCYNALPENGKVIIVERLLPVDPDTNIKTKNACSSDMMMMAVTQGGKERTEKEFEALAKSAGFVGFQVVCSVYDFNVMEFLKNV